MFFSLKEEDFAKYVKELSSSMSLIAPIKGDIARYQYSKDLKDMVFEQPAYPVNTLLFGKEETLFTYQKDKISLPKPPEKTLCFLSRPDTLAFQVLDKLLLD